MSFDKLDAMVGQDTVQYVRYADRECPVTAPYGGACFARQVTCTAAACSWAAAGALQVMLSTEAACTAHGWPPTSTVRLKVSFTNPRPKIVSGSPAREPAALRLQSGSTFGAAPRHSTAQWTQVMRPATLAESLPQHEGQCVSSALHRVSTAHLH